MPKIDVRRTLDLIHRGAQGQLTLGEPAELRDGLKDLLYVHGEEPSIAYKLADQHEKIDLLSRENIRLADELAALKRIASPSPVAAPQLVKLIIPVQLWCPHCGAQHVDETRNGEKWDRRAHTTHRCQSCGNDWDVYVSGAPHETSMRDDEQRRRDRKEAQPQTPTVNVERLRRLRDRITTLSAHRSSLTPEMWNELVSIDLELGAALQEF